jgi:hypothetical protein
MKNFALILAMVVAAALPATAAQPYGGVNGYVATNGAPMADATVAVYRLPIKKGNMIPLHIVHTDKNGYFTQIPLERGFYLVSASSKDGHAGCAVANLNHVVVSRVRISLANFGQTCDEINVRSALVASDQGGNLTTVTIP